MCIWFFLTLLSRFPLFTTCLYYMSLLQCLFDPSLSLPLSLSLSPSPSLFLARARSRSRALSLARALSLSLFLRDVVNKLWSYRPGKGSASLRLRKVARAARRYWG